MELYLEIKKAIEEQIELYEGDPNCLIISSFYYHYLLEHIHEIIDIQNYTVSKLFGLNVIVIESPRFIKVTRREII